MAAALRMLEQSGPEAIQARAVAAQAGTSTQALYTVFGGVPGLIETVVADGFARFGAHVAAVPETADPVADHFTKGGAYCDWALAHPQLYRLMFGLTGGALRPHAGLEATLGGRLTLPDGQAALAVLIRSLDRVKEAGRIRSVDTVMVAAQFLSATHGYVLLQIAGAFGTGEPSPTEVIAALGMNLMVGLGDDPAAAGESLVRALEARAPHTTKRRSTAGPARSRSG
jgi:AcrR family transcriptional regulator